MASVRGPKAAVIDALSFSRAIQPGVTGAAMLAAYTLAGADLAGPHLAGPDLASRDIVGFIREGMT
jgi:hypothetical protein